MIVSTPTKIRLLKRLFCITKGSLTVNSGANANGWRDNVLSLDLEAENDMITSENIPIPRTTGNSVTSLNDIGIESSSNTPTSSGILNSPSGSGMLTSFNFFQAKIGPQEDITTLTTSSHSVNSKAEACGEEADGELPVHTDDEGIFFHMLFVLLSGKAWAIVIEDAHHCDGSSWNVIYMLSHMLVNAVMLITLRSLHAHQLSHGPGWVSGVDPDAIQPVSSNSANFAWTNFHGNIPVACVYLLENVHTIHVLLKPFTLKEVKYFMCRALNCNTLPDELVDSIFQVSTGSPFWCKQIANFINERGRDLFIKTTISDDKSTKTNPLHVLIICRLEAMSIEQQAVIKHASIIGEEFHAALLEKILPPLLKEHLIDTIAVLVNNGLLFSENENTDTYKFGNHLIHTIIYDLTPPR